MAVTVSDHRMHLEREDVTLSGDFVENEVTTQIIGTDNDVSTGHHQMKMYFHTSYGDNYLFKDWLLSSASDTVVACLVLFFVAIVYEGIKTYQNQLLKKKYSHGNCYPVASQTASSDAGNGCHDSRPWIRQMFSLIHALSTLLHVVQVTLGYSLMLAIMTFNVWLIVAVVTGAGVGYFVFSWKRRAQASDGAVENCYLNKSFVGDFNTTGFK